MKNKTLCLCFLIALMSVFSCRRSYHTQQPSDTEDVIGLQKEAMMQFNQQLVEEEFEEIKNFVEQRNWNMTTTETGLWIEIYSKGEGEKAVKGKIVALKYSLSLLDGAVCYDSSSHGLKTFRLGYEDVESGLTEGVLLMSAGDKARMILPPHLAHGIAGDGDCIPQRAIIVYDVELVNNE